MVREPVERDDSQSGKEQSQRAATHGSGKHAAHSRSPRTHQGWHTLQHPAREVLDKRRVPDAVEGNEQELRTTSSLARTSSSGGGRVRSNVPESLANCLGPLAMETGAAALVAPSSDVRERLSNAPLPRRQPLESRLGNSVDQNQPRSQTVSRTSDPPTTATPASTANQSTSAMPVEGVEPSSVLLWNRPDSSDWGQYKTDMSARLNMNTLTCREDARKLIGGEGPTVSRLYRIPGVDWLLAEQD